MQNATVIYHFKAEVLRQCKTIYCLISYTQEIFSENVKFIPYFFQKKRVIFFNSLKARIFFSDKVQAFFFLFMMTI